MTGQSVVFTLAALAISACATSGLEERLARLERENTELRQSAAGQSAQPSASMPAVVPPAAHMQRPFAAFVDYKPAFCNDGGLCLEVKNERPHVVGRLEINGQPVVFGRGSLLGPNRSAFIRLLQPGEYVVVAYLYDLVDTGDGRQIPRNVLRETCRIERYIGTIGDAKWGPTVALGPLHCASGAGR
ncbi:MAG: hypothetical protein V1723_04480 [Candidatus Uhrbacteria bacterium]